MARPALTRSDYIKAGHEKGLEFIGKKVPTSVHTATEWRCVHCGEIHHKSFRAVKYRNTYGCTCQNELTLKPKDYHDLAARLGITWAGMQYSGRVPKNTKTPTIWIGPNGKPVEATYQQLAYGELSGQLRRQLGLPDPEPASD